MHAIVLLAALSLGVPAVAHAQRGSGAGATTSADRVVETLRLIGPIPSVSAGDPSRNYPFFSTTADLGRYDYQELEYFFEGVADQYDTPAQATGKVLSRGHRFKTRLLVRKPRNASRFNGTVIVEWNNVTAGRDLDIDWFQSHDYFMRAGYAWVGVSAQRVGVGALKAWNAERYGTLDVTDGGRVDNDALSYFIFAGVGRAARGTKVAALMPELRVQRVFATGHSQSASRLANYVNSVDPLHQGVFDAIVVHGGGGRIRRDAKTRVFKLLAETDVIGSQAANRQPDSSRMVTWEVAGSSHVDAQFVASSRALAARDGSPVAQGFVPGGNRTTLSPAAPGQTATLPPAPTRPAGSAPNACDRPSYSQIPFHYVMNAAYDHLGRWVRDGARPPSAPPIRVTTVGPPAIVERDSVGNALGGIRLAQHDVPTGVNTGLNSGPGFCRLNGSHEDFDRATLAARYPSHDAYVAAVERVTNENVAAGYLLPEDAAATVAEAKRSTVGRR